MWSIFQHKTVEETGNQQIPFSVVIIYNSEVMSSPSKISGKLKPFWLESVEYRNIVGQLLY